MSQSFTLTVPDEFLPLIEWALQNAQDEMGDMAPNSKTALIKEAFLQSIIPGWQAARASKTVVDLQTTLRETDDDEKATVVDALMALKSMNKQQRMEALQSLINLVPEG